MVRTTVGTIAEAELSVQRAESVTQISASSTLTVPSGGIDTTAVTAPTGTVLEVLGLEINIEPPPGATTGDHILFVRGPELNVRYIACFSSFDTGIKIRDGRIFVADQGQDPSTEVGQQGQIRSIRIDDTNGAVFEYENRTDVDQTNEREIQILALERGVA
jgi:hypothetical protein